MSSIICGPIARCVLALSLAGCAVLIPAAAASAASEPTRIRLAQADAGMPATFSAEQADHGKELYDHQCTECHGSDLSGGLLGGPPLRGAGFAQKFFDGAPASGLFLFMSTLMPPNAPGRFSASAYADMMAYILKRNGFRAGAELPSDVEALDNLILKK